jgi:hypothetical protein
MDWTHSWCTPKLVIVSFSLKQTHIKKMNYDAPIYLVENWILGLEASASKLNNLLISARFLSAKLVAWESKDLKTCGVTEILACH